MPEPQTPDPSAPRPGRPEAARVIWSRPDAGELRRSQARDARRQGLLRGGIGLLLAAALFLVGWRIVATIALVIGVVTLLAGLLSPHGAHRMLDRAFHALIAGIGQLMTWLTLTPVFLLVFVPYGLLFRRGHRDRLHRWFDADADSYWTSREPSPDPAARHERQF